MRAPYTHPCIHPKHCPIHHDTLKGGWPQVPLLSLNHSPGDSKASRGDKYEFSALISQFHESPNFDYF